MKRNAAEERDSLASFKRWRRARPGAALLLGTVEVDPVDWRCKVQFTEVGCCPVAMAGAAAYLMQWASKHLRAAPATDDAGHAIQALELACAALDFDVPEHVQ